MGARIGRRMIVKVLYDLELLPHGKTLEFFFTLRTTGLTKNTLGVETEMWPWIII